MKKIYEDKMNDIRSFEVNYDKDWFNDAMRLIENHNLSFKNYIDFGCSAGEMMDLISRKKYLEKKDIWGADVSSSSLAKVASRGYKTVLFDGENIESLPKELEKKFDLATCLESIEHVFDADTYLQIIYSSLKENGKLILSTPNILFIKYYLHSVRGGIPWKEGHHLRFWDRARIQQYLVMNGFTVVDFLHNKKDKKLPGKIISIFSDFYSFLFNKEKRGLNKYISFLPISDFIVLLKKDENFFPLGVSEHMHIDLNIPEKYDRRYMFEKIKNELFETNCIDANSLKNIKKILNI